MLLILPLPLAVVGVVLLVASRRRDGSARPVAPVVVGVVMLVLGTGPLVVDLLLLLVFAVSVPSRS